MIRHPKTIQTAKGGAVVNQPFFQVPIYTTTSIVIKANP